MRNIDSFLQASSGEDDANNKKHLRDLTKVFKEYHSKPQSMRSVSDKLSIDRSSVCWYNRIMRLNGRIWAFKKEICPVSKRSVILWTTDINLKPPTSQLNLFPND